MQNVTATISKSSDRSLRLPLRRIFGIVAACALCFAVVRVVAVQLHRRGVANAEWRNAMEILHLHQALAAYKIEFQEFPPSANAEAIREHVSRVFPTVKSLEERIRSDKRDISELDDRELLVFWLGEASGTLGAQTGNPAPTTIARIEQHSLYEFDFGRLIDSDNDGFLEYTDHKGNVFRLINRRVAIYCPESDRLITKKYLESKSASH